MEELWEFFVGEEARRYRRTFSRVGVAMLAMILLPVGVQLLLQYLLLTQAPALLEDALAPYLISAAATYLIGFPAAMLVLRTAPLECPDPERQRLNGGLAASFKMRFSRMDMPGTIPSTFRSSGT